MRTKVVVAVVVVARGKKFTRTKRRGRCSLLLGVIGELTGLDRCSLFLFVRGPDFFRLLRSYVVLFSIVPHCLSCLMHLAFLNIPLIYAGKKLMRSSDWQLDRTLNSTRIACKLSRRSLHQRTHPIPPTATRISVMLQPSSIIRIHAPRSFGRRMLALAHVTCWPPPAITCDYGACPTTVLELAR